MEGSNAAMGQITPPVTAAAKVESKATTSTDTSTTTACHLPWYRAGGMKINMVGMGINISIPVIVLAQNLTESNLKSFVILLLSSYAASLVHRRSLYCIVVMPTFLTSLLLCFSLDTLTPHTALTLAIAIAICKVNICMSVCLHRYAAHAAFKCGTITNTIVLILGCLANQGGPIWWASQHRLHHKHCDIPRDPHSPILDGTEKAFSFFEVHDEVEEEFTPNHFDSNSVLLRIVDTWSWAFVCLELCLSYYFFGSGGLFVSFTSGWLCQSITLWFNVVNHPPDNSIDVDVRKKKKEEADNMQTPSSSRSSDEKRGATAECRASNGTGESSLTDFYIPFMLLNALVPLFSTFVKESEHQHHHVHAQLAKRSKFDTAYWSFVWPLEQVGLVWNVVSKE